MNLPEFFMRELFGDRQPSTLELEDAERQYMEMYPLTEGQEVNVPQDGIFGGVITRMEVTPNLHGGEETKVWVKDQYGDECGYPPAAIEPC